MVSSGEQAGGCGRLGWLGQQACRGLKHNFQLI